MAHEDQSILAIFQDEAEVELPAYQASLAFSYLIRAVGRLTDAEKAEVDAMIKDHIYQIEHYKGRIHNETNR